MSPLRPLLLCMILGFAVLASVALIREPKRPITYNPENDQWKSAANERIDRYRKSDIILDIEFDSNKYEYLEVKIEQLRHSFSFGTAIDAYDYTAIPEYAQKIHRYFNEVVLENDLKWQQWSNKQPTSKYRQSRTLEAIRNLKDSGINVRGHCLLWAPILDYERIDQAISPNVYQNDKRFIQAQLSHVQDLLHKTKGYINEWDAINHLVSKDHKNTLLLEEKYGLGIYREVFALRKYFGLSYYVNESKVLTSRGEKYLPYLERVTKMKAEDLSPDGIGFMSHFEPDNLPDMDTLYGRLDTFASLGVDLKITEFDIMFGKRGIKSYPNENDLQLQAQFTEDFLRMCFSHPKMRGIMLWGFWEQNHWYPDAALWSSEWEIKPNGKAWLDLVHKEWWTQEEHQLTKSNNISTRGFKGDYSIKIYDRPGNLLHELYFSLGDTSYLSKIKIPAS
ncbi:endo-1,4-beta-xylanase [Belliella marina]|uniref:endo-1,4-beta-xylanase n=1 Tax=Belliella marina TaxID=1644146 RepID=A0ABW4VNW4_9BACT